MTGRILQVLLMTDVGWGGGGVEELVLIQFVAWVGVEVP